MATQEGITIGNLLDEIEQLRAERDEYARQRNAQCEHDAAEIERLQSALRDLIAAYLADVNPNDRNQAAIEHARRNIQ